MKLLKVLKWSTPISNVMARRAALALTIRGVLLTQFKFRPNSSSNKCDRGRPDQSHRDSLLFKSYGQELQAWIRVRHSDYHLGDCWAIS